MDMKMNELARVGFVVSRQPEKHRVRVEFRDTVTAKRTRLRDDRQKSFAA